MNKLSTGFSLLILTLSYGCKKSFTPNVAAGNTNYLVVEGVINTGNDSTIFKLSRTVNLGIGTDSTFERGAQVIVENDQNASYTVPEIGQGKYAAPALGLDNTHKYRLRVKTVDGKVYLSDFAAPTYTPPIDSIGFTINNKGIQIYANAHNANNTTRYYRWDYVETWEFHAKYQSFYIYNGIDIVPRTPDQNNIYYCYGNNTSTGIVLGSTAALSQDVVYQAPITTVESTSEKIELEYSILLHQYGLSKDAFTFYQTLKKNTEQIGSIFDAQPSTIDGNMHCITNPSVPVIGYITATNVQEKRIFIYNSQVPRLWQPTYPYNCPLDSLLFCRGKDCQNEVKDFLMVPNSPEIPVTTIPAKVGPGIIGYFGAGIICVDCTLRGVTKRPDFWK
ncbi:MAG: DUF4249 domain-containing protein [Sphingobacteriales bacterium]